MAAMKGLLTHYEYGKILNYHVTSLTRLQLRRRFGGSSRNKFLHGSKLLRLHVGVIFMPSFLHQNQSEQNSEKYGTNKNKEALNTCILFYV